MTDLISRAEAISAICEDGTKLEQQGRYIMSMSRRKQRDADILSALPTVDAVPVVHGHWIDLKPQGDSRFMCTVCKWKEKVPTCMGEPTIWMFCPSCGARMDGKDGEQA